MTPTSRKTTVVCRVIGGADEIEAGLRNVLEHTAPEIAIVVVAGAADRPVPARVLEQQADRAGGRMRFSHLTDPTALAASLAPADLAIVDLPCRVSAGWLEGLRLAAGGGAEVAVAIALEIDVSGPVPWPVTRSEPIARGPRAAPTATRCRFVRRSAIELIGAADLGLELMTRAQQAGLACILAEEVLVSPGAVSPAPAPGSAAAARALAAVRRPQTGLRVVVDARCLGGARDGTQTHVLGLLGALAGTGGLNVTALVPADLDPEPAATLEQTPTVELVRIPASGSLPDGLRADIVHRPFQIAADAELVALARIGERLVITHQDLISYHQREYFASEPAWVGYREMTRRALRIADHVAFFSAHVRDEALAEGLIEPHRASVTPLGVDAEASAESQSPVRPPGLAALSSDAEMILCLGSDFVHKNRRFALQVVRALQREHDWAGRLVFAGPRVALGSSRRAEAEDLAADPRLREAVLDAGEVTGPQRAWLLARCSLVLYPTLQEGFGLIPFEAAAAGRPCLWAAGSALAELLPVTAAEIVAWDPAATAQGALGLMRDAFRRQANIDAVMRAGDELTWERAGARNAALYAEVCAALPSPMAQLEREQGRIGAGLSEDAIRLVGPGGALPRDVERPLLALATHHAIARPVFAALVALYRLGRGLGRGASARRRTVSRRR